MAHLIYVTLASESLSDNTELYPTTPETAPTLAALKGNWHVEQAGPPQWNNLHAQLRHLWPISDGSQPFSELRPFAAHSGGVLYDKVTMHVLSNPEEDEYAISTALRTDDFKKYATELLQTKNHLAGTGNITVKQIPLPVKPNNKSENFSPLRAAIFDECAAIAAGLTADNDPKVLVNGVGGANVGVEALIWAAGVFGWDISYGPNTKVRIPPPAVSPASVGAAWARAMTLVSSNVAELAEKVLADAQFNSELDLAKDYLERAADSDVLPLVKIGTAPNSNRRCLDLSRMAGPLIELGNQPKTLYSATQRMLVRYSDTQRMLARPDRDAAEFAKRLHELLQGWAKSDLFGANLVHELVLHGVSHCEAVDRNVASLCEPLLEDGFLDPVDVFDLAVSAWLHDWGHSGMPLAEPAALGNLLLPTEIRETHGVISAYRIDQNKRTSQVKSTEAARIQTICAHHQGWSSITATAPSKPPKAGVGETDSIDVVGTRALLKDWRDFRKKNPVGIYETTTTSCDEVVGDWLSDPIGAEEITVEKPAFARLQLLVALFRIADAADLGLHRVPVMDEGAQKERCLEEARLGILTQLRRGVQDQFSREDARAFVAYATEKLGLHEQMMPEPARQRVDDFKHCSHKEYVDHCVAQMGYYQRHKLVRGAYLTMTRTNDETTHYAITAHVIPNPDPVDFGSCVRAEWAVKEDIYRELGDVLRSETGDALPADEEDITKLAPEKLKKLTFAPDGPAQKKAVRAILRKRNISFAGAETEHYADPADEGKNPG